MDKKERQSSLSPASSSGLLDALWASKGGPDGLPTAQPNFLAMGVFAPVFDYNPGERKFRGEKMGWKPNMSATRRFLSEFGYEERDLPGGGKDRRNLKGPQTIIVPGGRTLSFTSFFDLRSPRASKPVCFSMGLLAVIRLSISEKVKKMNNVPDYSFRLTL